MPKNTSIVTLFSPFQVYREIVLKNFLWSFCGYLRYRQFNLLKFVLSQKYKSILKFFDIVSGMVSRFVKSV